MPESPLTLFAWPLVVIFEDVFVPVEAARILRLLDLLDEDAGRVMIELHAIDAEAEACPN